jgi:hypothetical protein
MPNHFLEFKSNHFKSSSLIFLRITKVVIKIQIYLGYFLLPPLPQISLGPTDHLPDGPLSMAGWHQHAATSPLAPKLQAEKKTHAASASSQALPSLFILYHLTYICGSKGANGLYKNIQVQSLSNLYRAPS